MPDCYIVYWRDIPAQVLVKAGRKTAKRELPKRFIEAIDRVAMREGLTATDDYLALWRRGPPTPCGEDLEAEADRALVALEAHFTGDVLKRLVETGGRDERPRLGSSDVSGNDQSD